MKKTLDQKQVVKETNKQKLFNKSTIIEEEKIVDKECVINPFRTEYQKELPSTLLNSHKHLFTRQEFIVIDHLLDDNYEVQVEVYNGRITSISSTKSHYSEKAILRLNIRTTKDSSNE